MWNLGFHINNYTQSKASGERVLELLNTPVDVQETEDPIIVEADQVKGHVTFDSVTFAYGNKMPAVTDINFDAPPGTVIGFLGGTGSGKSTIIQLLMRAYNVNSGTIKLDGKILRTWGYAACAARSLLFSGNVPVLFQHTQQYLVWSQNVSMDDIIRAAKLAKA